MKATGIVRKIDELGRLVIPKELRKTLSIEPSDSIEIYADEGGIVLRKYEKGCVFCGKSSLYYAMSIKGQPICENCLQLIASKFDLNEWRRLG